MAKKLVINTLVAIISNRLETAHEAGQMNYPIPNNCKHESIKKLVEVELGKL